MSRVMWIIIILLIVSYFQYSNPIKTNSMLNPVWGTVKDYVDNNNLLKRNFTGACPDVAEVVCGNNGISYKNSCEAALAGILEVSPGAC